MTARVATSLLPRPQRLQGLDGHCPVAEIATWSLLLKAAPAPTPEEAAALTAEIAELLPQARSVGDAACASRCASALRLPDPSPPTLRLALGEEGVAGRGPESYRLIADVRGIEIRGSTPRALYWGLQTLRQWRELAGADVRQLPAVRIEDWPAWSFRGYSDDISRRQVSTLRDFEFTIRQLSRWKINVYQPYMEDLLRLDRHPMLGLGRGRLSRDEVAALIAFGRRHFVEIMPQLNAGGHCEHMLARPEYARWRFEGNLETLDPRRRDVRAYLRDAYAQLLEQFPCCHIHLGLDEARGLIERPDLYVAHANRLAAIVARAGRTPLMWHDMFVPYHRHAKRYGPHLLADLDRRIVLDVWIYNRSEPHAGFLDELERHGFRGLVSPMIAGGPCGAGTRAQWEQANWLLRHARRRPAVFGVLNTAWNDSGQTDRRTHWRGQAISAALLWSGPQPETALEGAQTAYARHFHGLHRPADAAALTDAAEFGRAQERLAGLAVARPRGLAQSVTDADCLAAREARRRLPVLRRGLLRARAVAVREADQIDHLLGGLDTVLTGAERVLAAPRLRQALCTGDLRALTRLCGREATAVRALRERFAALWLRRNKPEGLEHADLRFRRTLSDIEHLPWQLAHAAVRHSACCAAGWEPLDTAPAATEGLRELKELPLGACVLDNVPWRIPDPLDNDGHALLWLRSEQFPQFPAAQTVGAGHRAVRFHALHAVYGVDRAGVAPGGYRLVFADGSAQTIPLRPTLDIGDWWMPYGHIFGGGAALRIDPATCRLAFLSDVEAFQGHALYHFQAPIVRQDVPVVRVEVHAGDPACSLIVAALTLESP